MTPAAWISIAVALLSILGSGLAAWIAVRVGQARDSQRLATLEPEVLRTRESVHELRDTWNPILAKMQVDIAKVEGQHEEQGRWRGMVLDLVKMVIAARATD